MRQSRRIIQVLMVLIAGVCLRAVPVEAQTNLLQTGNFDGTYHGMGTAANWEGWFTNSPRTQGWMNVDPGFFPHTGSIKRSGDASQNIGRDGGTWTAAVWQRVDNIPEGTALRATAWVYMESGQPAQARMRIGIGSNTTDPANPAITWGNPSSTINSWHEISVDAVLPAGSATVFIYGTQNFPNGPTGPQQLYIEDASMVAVGTGTVPTPGEGGGGGVVVPVVPPTPVPQLAAAVGVQDSDASDGLTHIVQSGDTLAAIAVAYGTRTSVLRELNNLPQGSFLQVGQTIIVAPPSEDVPEDTAEPEADAPTVEAQSAQPTSQAALPTQVENPPTAVQASPTSEPPTEAPTLDVTLTPSPVPPSATPAATAVVTAGVAGNPVSIEAGVCVLMFDDKNQNRLQGSDEAPLAGGEIELIDRAGNVVETRTTTADGEPACFVDVVPGNYSLSATPPDGYGLTTSATLSVSVQAGTQFQISFGAAEGVETTAAPTPDNQVIGGDNTADSGTADAGTDPRSLLGIVFIGLAAVVLVGGLALAVVIRRL